MKNPSAIIILLTLTALVAVGIFYLANHFQTYQFQSNANRPLIINKIVNNTGSSSPDAAASSPALIEPLTSALKRVTKKPFGIYITPKNSPVSPEKFTGHHTGVDFEILPGEKNIDVPVDAVCSGQLLLKKSAAGYGGVAVESCKLNNQDITIVYGHLKLSSINLKVGQTVAPGEKIGILGQSYSSETNGERKHLHLGLHRGSAINLLGYVPDKKLLDDWLNALDYLK